MESVDLVPILERLDDDVDDLEEALQPILESTVVQTSQKLPVMDKAKFHVWVTYALESLIFSYMRLHGVKATDHPVFTELKRVKQYFDKIKALETEPEQRNMVLDKQAAGRFIKHGLAGNEKYDLQREEQLAKEKARAQLKASMLAKKAGGASGGSANQAPNDSESEANPNPDAEDAETSRKKSSESSAGKPKKAKKDKKDKKKGGAKESRHKKHRSKEDRKESHKERRKKKDESQKARKET